MTDTPTKPSRLQAAIAKAERAEATADAPEAHDDFVRAEDRFARFRSRFKEGQHDAEVVNVIQHPDGHLTYVVKASVWKNGRSPYGSGYSEAPDATALVAKSTNDPDPITAASALATADTVARSRALRNLGVLATKSKPKAKPDA